MEININDTLKQDLCTGCGICQGSCPQNAISTEVVKGNFRPSINNALCINCGRCLKVCPGVEINLVGRGVKLFTGAGSKNEKYIGRYLSCYAGYSNDKELRYHAASGGMLSQFLIWLIENKKIDGAYVTKFDKDAPLKVTSFLATTPEDIRSAKSSKYAPVSLNRVADDIKTSEGLRYVIVGLPCHIEGLRKLMDIDKRLREKIVGLFAIYCSGSRSFYMTEYIMRERHINLTQLTYLAYRDNGCLGGLVAKGDNIDYYEDYQSYYHPLRSIFTPRRCILCADHFGELADISFGDIHVKPYSEDKIGINSVVVRSAFWQSLLKEAEGAGIITLNELESDVLLSAQKMAKVKKGRNVRYGMLLSKLGYKAPNYGTIYNNKLSYRDYINYIINRLQQLIGSHKHLWFLIPMIKGKVNIH